jgi:hypothetical protein
MPVVRVDNHLLFPGGHVRRMTLLERLAWRLGRRTVHTR